MGSPPLSPHSLSPRELAEVREAERRGEPFLAYRGADGNLRLVRLEGGARPLSVGRTMDADISLTWDEQVSRLHAEFDSQAGEWTVSDDGLSKNGTYVNARRISGRHRLQDGDAVRIGGTVMVFRSPAHHHGGSTVAAADIPTVEHLSETQRRILIALCRPYRHAGGFVRPATNQQIADEVFLTVEAVKKHLRSLFQRFDLDELPQNEKRVKLAECVLEGGLISQRDLEG